VLCLCLKNWKHLQYVMTMKQSEDLRKVTEFLALRPRQARTLLIHYRWNVENLFCALVERGTEPIFLEAGLPPTDASSVGPNTGQTSPSAIKCRTCLEDVSSSSTTRMDCGHAFCNDCKHRPQLKISFS
jgi:ariadne-1